VGGIFFLEERGYGIIKREIRERKRKRERRGKERGRKNKGHVTGYLNITIGLRAPIGRPDPNIAMGRPAKRPVG
jgi:hypothetical protein